MLVMQQVCRIGAGGAAGVSSGDAAGRIGAGGAASVAKLTAGKVGIAGIGKPTSADNGRFVGKDGLASEVSVGSAASMAGLTGKADITGTGFTFRHDFVAGSSKSMGRAAMLLRDIMLESNGSNPIFSAVWHVELVELPRYVIDETIGEGFCLFDNMEAGAGKIMFLSHDDTGCRFLADSIMGGVAELQETR